MSIKWVLALSSYIENDHGLSGFDQALSLCKTLGRRVGACVGSEGVKSIYKSSIWQGLRISNRQVVQLPSCTRP